MSNEKDWVKEIIEIMARLRAPNGCPWDLEQDHKSLKPYLIEESCEVLDAIDDNNMKDLKEELGDVLMNIVFHAQIAQENGFFNFQDVAQAISEKMVHRHPHVFDESCQLTSAEVLAQWEIIKAQEKTERESILDGIPRSFPGLLRAQKIQKKVAKVGFDWSDKTDVLKKVQEEFGELQEAIEQKNTANIEEEFGDLLFSMVNLARHLQLNADHSLNLANNKFSRRFKQLEKVCREKNLMLENLSLSEMDKIWDEVKAEEKRRK
jgi:MazG family protein